VPKTKLPREAKAPASKDNPRPRNERHRRDPPSQAPGGAARRRRHGLDPLARYCAVKEAIAQARKGEPSRARELRAHDRRSVHASCRVGDSCAATTTRATTPLCRLHHRKCELAEHRLPCGAAPRRRSAGPPRSRDRAGAFGKDRPVHLQGQVCAARALLLQGDRAGAQSLVREAWRYESFSRARGPGPDVFRELITSADHKRAWTCGSTREDADGAMRSANRAGGHAPVIAKARIAVIKKAANARRARGGAERRAATSATSSAGPIAPPRGQGGRGGRIDAGRSQRIQRRQSTPTSGGSSAAHLQELIDLGDPKTAYRVASAAVVPHRITIGRAQFTPAGSRCASSTIRIPRSAHFAKVGQAPATDHRSHAPLWEGVRRGAGKQSERVPYETAARYSTVY